MNKGVILFSDDLVKTPGIIKGRIRKEYSGLMRSLCFKVIPLWLACFSGAV